MAAADAVDLAVDQVLAGEAIHVGAELAIVEARSRRAQADERVGDPAAVGGLEGVEQLDQGQPLVGAQFADEAEVEEDDLTGLRVDEDVARVRIAVEEAVDEDLLDERPDEDRAQVGRVHAGGAQALDVGDLDALHELRGQDARAWSARGPRPGCGSPGTAASTPRCASRGTPRCGSRAP